MGDTSTGDRRWKKMFPSNDETLIIVRYDRWHNYQAFHVLTITSQACIFPRLINGMQDLHEVALYNEHDELGIIPNQIFAAEDTKYTATLRIFGQSCHPWQWIHNNKHDHIHGVMLRLREGLMKNCQPYL